MFKKIVLSILFSFLLPISVMANDSLQGKPLSDSTSKKITTTLPVSPVPALPDTPPETASEVPLLSMQDGFFSLENETSPSMRHWRSTVLNTQYITNYLMSISGVSYAYFHLSPLPDKNTKDEKLRLTREYLVRVQGDKRIMSASIQVMKTVQEILKIQPVFYQQYLELLNMGYIEKLSETSRIIPEKIFKMFERSENTPVSSILDNLIYTDSLLKQILEVYKKFLPFYEKELESFKERRSNESFSDFKIER